MSETRFRWVRRPSEEALLGLSGGHTPRQDGPRPTPQPFPAPVAGAAAAPARNRRIGARELAAVGAVGALVWLAVHIAGGEAPSRSPGPSVPTVAASEITRTLASDRRGHASRPRTQTRTVEKEAAATGKAAGAEEGQTTPQPRADDDEDADGSPGDDSSPRPPPPPTEPSDPPLLAANVPGVGSVTVEQADLPDADDVLPETPTLPAP